MEIGTDSYAFPCNSLRAQMTYPREEALLSEKEAIVLLKDVGLGVLTERYSVDDVKDWTNVLSGGQKQRLSWARLFFHCPKYALLDEATSAISTDMVDNLFEQAKRRNITLLTISHSAQVDAHHQRAIGKSIINIPPSSTSSLRHLHAHRYPRRRSL